MLLQDPCMVMVIPWSVPSTDIADAAADRGGMCDGGEVQHRLWC